MLLLDILAKMTEQLASALADEEQLSPSLLILGPPGVGEFSWHRLSKIEAAGGTPLCDLWAHCVCAMCPRGHHGKQLASAALPKLYCLMLSCCSTRMW